MAISIRFLYEGEKYIFRFTKLSEVEVFLLLESMDCKKSFGHDKIHPLLLSSAALELLRPVTYIINLKKSMLYRCFQT